MIPIFINKSLLPHSPGVYLYKDEKSKIIYVGKALDLYHRVASYFSVNHLRVGDAKTAALVDNIKAVETIIVESELEALILEAALIKKHRPIFNIRLMDDKDYLYIKVTKEPFPRIITARKKDRDSALKFFGPFPSATTVKSTLKRLRKVFPWCSNPQGKRACFYYHIGQCPGACTGEISQKEYHKIINRFCAFLEGRKIILIANLTKEMMVQSKSQNYEQAERVKKMISGISYLTQTNRAEIYLENPNFLEDQRMLALSELKRVLNLAKIPERIEGYDVSNIQGHEAVASMVVLTNGEIDKKEYRKFKMFITGKPNDYAMHQETIRRRMKHSEWQTPDLLLIDGGKGQVSAVKAQIELSGLPEFKSIPVFGLAKRMEWLYSAEGAEIKLSRSSPALHLLQKLRDESHRFAITFHKKLRDKRLMVQ